MSKLRKHPTTPADDMLDHVNDGELWPRAFCAFAGCDWSSADGNERDLHVHLKKDHADDLAPIAAVMLRGEAPDALLSIYNAAVAVRCRSQAPLAGCSIDRRALNSFTEACSGDNVEALVCFNCACIHTCINELAAEDGCDIQWVRPLQQDLLGKNELSFLGRPLAEIVNLLGLDVFLQRYDKLSEEGGRISNHESFHHWNVQVPGVSGGLCKLLCCPEAWPHVTPCFAFGKFTPEHIHTHTPHGPGHEPCSLYSTSY